MSKRIYVGNLPFSASDHEIRSLFAPFGAVTSIEKVSGGLAIEMANGAEAALKALDNTTVGGKKIRVSEARPR